MNIIKVVIVDSKEINCRNMTAVYSKQVDFQIFPGLYIYDPVEGQVGNVSFRDGVYEGVIMREIDLPALVVERSGLTKIM